MRSRWTRIFFVIQSMRRSLGSPPTRKRCPGSRLRSDRPRRLISTLRWLSTSRVSLTKRSSRRAKLSNCARIIGKPGTTSPRHTTRSRTGTKASGPVNKLSVSGRTTNWRGTISSGPYGRSRAAGRGLPSNHVAVRQVDVPVAHIEDPVIYLAGVKYPAGENPCLLFILRGDAQHVACLERENTLISEGGQIRFPPANSGDGRVEISLCQRKHINQYTRTNAWWKSCDRIIQLRSIDGAAAAW